MQYETISSNAPKPWEREDTFHESLHEWMERSPWVGISVGLHFVAYFLLLAIPWHLFQEKPGTEIESAIIPALKEEEPVEPPPIEVVKTTEIEPAIQDPTIDDVDQQIDSPDDLAAGEPDQLAQSPFDQPALNAVIGVGGPPGGMIGSRGLGREGMRTGGGKPIIETIEAGLAWFA